MNILELLKDKEKELIIFKKYKKGTTIYKENDMCNHISIVIDGKIKISSYSLNGDEIVYNIVNRNQIFENNLVFSSHPFYKGDVIAIEDVELAIINKDNLLDILMNNRNFLEAYLSIQSNFSKNLNFRIKLLAIEKVKDRLLFYIQENGYDVSYTTISALALELNVERETLSRVISYLSKNKIITKDNKRLKIIR